MDCFSHIVSYNNSKNYRFLKLQRCPLWHIKSYLRTWMSMFRGILKVSRTIFPFSPSFPFFVFGLSLGMPAAALSSSLVGYRNLTKLKQWKYKTQSSLVSFLDKNVSVHVKRDLGAEKLKNELVAPVPQGLLNQNLAIILQKIMQWMAITVVRHCCLKKHSFETKLQTVFICHFPGSKILHWSAYHCHQSCEECFCLLNAELMDRSVVTVQLIDKTKNKNLNDAHRRSNFGKCTCSLKKKHRPPKKRRKMP